MPTPLLNDDEELLEAVKAGRESKVRALLLCGSGLNAADKEGKTAFHWACQYGHLQLLCLLLSHVPGATTASSDTEEESGVCFVCRGSQRVSSGLRRCAERSVGSRQNEPGSLELECQEDVHPSDCREKDSGDNSHIGEESHIGEGSIGEESHIGEERHIRDVSVLGPRNDPGRTDNRCTCNTTTTSRRRAALDIINTRDAKGQMPLHVACNYRRADVASFLVTLPNCDINGADSAGNTPLHRAIYNDLDAVACLLVDAGADVRAANSQNQTPLHQAVRSANHGVVRALLARGCDVNAVTRSAAAPTPFLTAVFYHKISRARSSASEGGRRGAAASLDTTLRLLIESGCRLSQGDQQWTPLSAAIDVDSSFVASLLLFNGCRVPHSGGERGAGYGRSLLVETFTHCEAHVVRLLVLCGYRPSLEEVQVCSRRIPSFSPLFYRISWSERAAMRSKSELLAWLRQRAFGSPLPSLMELSRTRVRRALNGASGDTSILTRISRLPLPSLLRQYVALSDFLANNCVL